tara:strand:- start:577 stop:846 length:270 start_codon:yes stop_codon:yes gene_type:complete
MFGCEMVVRVFKIDIPPKSAFIIKIPSKWKTLKDKPLEETRPIGFKLHPYIGHISPYYRDRRNDMLGEPIIYKKGHCNIGVFGGSVGYH